MRKIFSIIMISFSGLVIIYFSYFIGVDEIYCVPQDIDCNKITRILEDTPNDNDIQSVRKRLYRVLINQPDLINYQVRYKFPNDLTVDYTKKTPDFSLSKMNENSWYSLIDSRGKVLSVAEDTELLTIYSDRLPNPGESVSNLIIDSYNYYENIDDYFPVNRIEVKDDYFFVEFDNGHQAFIPNDKDMQLILGATMVVLNRLNTSIEKSIMNSRGNEKIYNMCLNGCLIDFRFHNPVIKDKI